MALRSASTILIALGLLSAQLPLQGAADRPADNTSFAVVELFTSEGCSSCPPADALLEKIHLKKTESGELIVGISEHVTYWNSDGWKDPFSAEQFTDRQTTYASRLSSQGPYTPQMVVNGRDQFVGNDTGALLKALQADAGKPHLDLQIVSAVVSDSGLNLQFLLKGAPPRPLDIIAVVTDDADHSNVLHGENSGKSLQHVSVARMLTRVATVRDTTPQTAHLQFPKGFDLKNGPGHHLILLAQEQHQGAIVGAAIQSI